MSPGIPDGAAAGPAFPNGINETLSISHHHQLSPSTLGDYSTYSECHVNQSTSSHAVNLAFALSISILFFIFLFSFKFIYIVGLHLSIFKNPGIVLPLDMLIE